MFDISENIKKLYKANSKSNPSAYFASKSLTLEEEIIDETPELIDSIVSSTDIVFGACITSQIKFSVFGVDLDLSGEEFTYSHLIGGNTVQIGVYKVDSCPKQDNKAIRDITAYDRMSNIDTDVAEWYNSLTFPMTLSAFRSSFLNYIGIEEDTNNLPLPNDSISVEKSIYPTLLKGRDVIEACEAVNGVFGHINRFGKFQHIILNRIYRLYPSQKLYPSNTLYPASETDFTYAAYKDEAIEKSMFERNSIKSDDYITKAIDKLIVRQEQDDVGAMVGTGTNTYILEGNFILYGKTSDELQTIANNLYGNIKDRPYKPYTCSRCIGLPYVEVGDIVKFDSDTSITSYVFQRTLSGKNVIKNTYAATGSKVLTQNTNVNYEIKQLKGKSLKLVKTVEELSGTITDVENNLTGEIKVLAGQIVLKATAAGVIAAVDLNADPEDGSVITFTADNITLEGLVTANSNFKILADGSVEAINAKFSGTIEGSVINGSEINGGSIKSSRWSGNSYGNAYDEIEMEAGVLTCYRTTYLAEQYGGTTKKWGATLDYNGLTAKYVHADKIGTSSDPVDTVYVETIYGDKADFGALYENGKKINTLYDDVSTTMFASFTGQAFRPSHGGNYSFYLGTSSYPWSHLYIKNIYHLSGGAIGFFGATPASKTSVQDLSSSATASETISKLNELLNALQNYGLV